MSRITKITTKIVGKNYLTSSLFLEQDIHWHHHFVVEIPANQLGNQNNHSSVGEVLDLVGKDIEIQVKKGKGDGLLFIGVVDEVVIEREATHPNTISVHGRSPSLKMEATRHTRSFSEKKLSSLVSEMLDDYQIKNTVHPSNDLKLAYTVQHNESAFHFLARLAERHNEWFYYNGQEVLFGNFKQVNKKEMKLGNILGHYNVALKLVPCNFAYTNYQYEKGEVLTAESAGFQVKGIDTFGKDLQSVSEDFFTVKATHFSHSDFHSQKEINDYVEGFKASLATYFVQLSGSSIDPSLTLGSTINVSEKGFKTEGDYIIINIKHSISGGQYTNEFTAIPASLDYPPPNPRVKEMIISGNQVATVKANDDPDGLGRVQVQFYWQQKNETTPWIRVMHPHVGEEGTFYFVPEIDEEVVVGFEYGNPERPYVIGSLHNGNAKPPYFCDKNSIKAITTKGGNRIIMVDGDEGSVSIYNKEDKNEITLSLADDGQIIIKTAGTLTLDAKTIEMKAENITMEASQGLEMKASQDATLSGQNVSLEAQQAIAAKGMEAKIEGQTAAELKGAQVKVDGQATTTIKGGLVQIN